MNFNIKYIEKYIFKMIIVMMMWIKKYIKVFFRHKNHLFDVENC